MNSAHGFSEGSEVPLTEAQRIEREAREYCHGSPHYLFEYRSYIAGATAELNRKDEETVKCHLKYDAIIEGFKKDNQGLQNQLKQRDETIQQLKEALKEMIPDSEHEMDQSLLFFGSESWPYKSAKAKVDKARKLLNEC